MTTATLEFPRHRRGGVPVERAAGAAGLLAVALSGVWLVAAAAQRASVLSPPTTRWIHAHVAGGNGWLLGPLSGLLPGLSHDRVRLHDDFAIALVVMFGGWLLAWAGSARLPLRVIAGFTAAMQLLYVLGPPQPLTDVFNYIVYGHMAVHGLNPYTVIPAVSVHDAAWELANWHHLESPYGPLFTTLCAPLGLTTAAVALWIWKALVLAGALAALWLVADLARLLGRSPQRALACAGLCPVTLAYGIGGLHNDLPAIVCLLGAVDCLLRARDGDRRFDAACGALAVAAAGFKPSFALAVPLLVLGARQRRAATAGAAGVAVAVAALDLAWFGGALPSIGTQSRLVTPLSVPNLVGLALGHHGADAWVRGLGRDALIIVTVGACAAVARRPRLVVPALGVVMVAAVLTLSWVMPWYLAWGLPFVALGMPRALTPAAVAMCVWLGVGGASQLPTLLHEAGYYPTRSATGRANHLYEVRLVR